MKKHLSALLAVLLVVCIALAGCGGARKESGDGNAQSDAQQQLDVKEEGKLSPQQDQATEPEPESKAEPKSDSKSDDSKSENTSESKTDDKPDSKSDDSKSESKSDSKSGSDKKDEETPAADHYDLLDAQGNPTFYSMLELDGTSLAAAVEGGDFTWDSDEKWWTKSSGDAYFYISGPDDYEYVRSEITDLQEGGKGKPCGFFLATSDIAYASSEAAFESLCNIEVLGIKWLDENTCVAVVRGPSGRTDFAILASSSGHYIISVFNKTAISSGMIDRYLGDDFGDTASEVWKNLFGESIE